MVELNLFKFLDIFGNWLVVLGDFWITLNTPINSALTDRFSPSIAIVRGFLNLIGVGNYTILEFIVGVGLVFFVVWTLLSWFLNIIT